MKPLNPMAEPHPLAHWQTLVREPGCLWQTPVRDPLSVWATLRRCPLALWERVRARALARPQPGPSHRSWSAYPERARVTEAHALIDAQRRLHSLITHLLPQPAARLPRRVARDLAATQRALAGLDAEQFNAAVATLRASLHASANQHGLTAANTGEALAVAGAAMTRSLGKTPYDSQYCAAWLILQGRLAEMATGEGKTLAAALAAAAAALGPVRVHLMTANDYLVQRDSAALAPFYAWLGLSVGCVVQATPRAARVHAYRCEITFVTAKELVFDHLKDHLLTGGERDPRVLRARALQCAPQPGDFPSSPSVAARSQGDANRMLGGADGGLSGATGASSAADSGLSACAGGPSGDAVSPARAALAPHDATSGPAAPLLPGLALAIIDEADAILLDEASLPLILAQPGPPLDAAGYRRAFEIAATLQRERDYRTLRASRAVRLTDAGRERVDHAVRGGDSANSANSANSASGVLTPPQRAHELVQAALAARWLFRRDREYAVTARGVQLIDEVTGRIAEGRQWTDALHQMVELKEGLAPSPPTTTAAQITYQRFFPRYLRLGGMSGTLTEARHELRMLYGVGLARVPLAHANRRRWLGQTVCVDAAAKWATVAATVQAMHRSGRPLLVGTDSVADSAHLSRLLHAGGIAHQVLNALQDADEAACIARAGRHGAVTVATNMAGRGTDIQLDAAAAAAGGLHVIACMRNRARRIDRQLTGRCARHGDPGSAQTVVALDDTLLLRTWPAWLRRAAAAGAVQGRVPALPAPPALLAWLLLAIAQRRCEWQEARHRKQLRRAERQLGELYGFAGLTE